MNTAKKLQQLQKTGIGYATLIAHALMPYVIMAATKKDLVALMGKLEKIPADKVKKKLFHRVKIVGSSRVKEKK